MRRLRDLDPKLSGTLDDGLLRFDCPSGEGHAIRIPLGGTWKATGEYPDSLTITPSINEEGCWHGWIKNGEAA